MIIYVDMDDTLCAFMPAYQEAKRNIEFPQSIPGFFASLEPVEGAIDAVNRLRKHHEVYILTAPSVRNPNSYTEKRIWLETHFDYALCKRLIISPNKGLLKGDYLIDDYLSGKGQEAFEGNIIHFNSEKYPDWPSVLSFFNL